MTNSSSQLGMMVVLAGQDRPYSSQRVKLPILAALVNVVVTPLLLYIWIVICTETPAAEYLWLVKFWLPGQLLTMKANNGLSTRPIASCAYKSAYNQMMKKVPGQYFGGTRQGSYELSTQRSSIGAHNQMMGPGVAGSQLPTHLTRLSTLQSSSSSASSSSSLSSL